MKFSQRKGRKPVSDRVQRDGMDEPLRNTLWNVLDLFIWSREGFLDAPSYTRPGIDQFSRLMWLGYFKQPIDSRPDNAWGIHQHIRHYFFTSHWYEVYDLLEWVLRLEKNDDLTDAINEVLERELSAYRYVGDQFTDITDPQEVEMLQEALEDTDYPTVRAHLARALELLSDRKAPDYRNSIKESISAVEALARQITGNSSATLADALKSLHRVDRLHPALRDGFLKLYGYTSDENGIRHAMLEEPNLSVDEARYFLLSCTAFINYLKSRSR